MSAEFEPFPVHSLVPKRETGAERFLSRFPHYDGRGVVMAIFDTGVDPGAPGLSVTMGGERKIVDLVDTTGNGDVDTSTVCTTDVAEGRQIQGLSGRTLTIPNDWVNPSGKWHVGIKALFDLFPSVVKSRIQTKYKSKEWEPKHEALMSAAVRRLVEFEAEHPNISDKDLEERFELEELKAAIDVLNSLNSKCSLAGPVCDCVVFHDGNNWCAVVDTTEEGNLADCVLLQPYRVSGQFAKFGQHDQVNYSINVYEEGNLLCIVTTGGAHGTHVASIAGAHFPEDPERDGVAPGAQIVSVKIGDTRLSTMETSASLIRAAIVAVELKVDVINFSYGECSHWNNSGAVIEEFIKLCDQHNIVFVSSAGNNGPALSTVGCPGGTIAPLIGVGAFVSPDMMLGEYSLTHRKAGLPYTWSSRGPIADGGLGVTVTAPGGAVTSVPNWTLRKKQLMNGTSMSSPNVCGCIALMMSALKAQGVSYSPGSIKRTLGNTAIPLGSHDTFSVGHGVIQIDKAYEQYMENQSSSINSIRFVVTASSKKGVRGIYLRDHHQLQNVTRTSINVDATFHEDAAPEEKLKFEMELALLSTHSWVTVPNHLCMWTGGRQFVVEVDPRGLESGAHYAEVTAYDVTGNIKGALFRVPVSVIIPHKLSDEKNGTFTASAIELKRADPPHRLFFRVPHNATWAAVKVSNNSTEVRSRVTIQSVQLLPEQGFRENESYTTMSLDPGTDEETLVPVESEVCLEVCLAPYWSDVRDALISVSITFHSLHPSTKDLTFHSGTMWTSFDVVASMGQEQLAPEFKLTHHVVPKRPSENCIKPLGHRDILPDGKQIYEIVLTYNFSVPRSCDVRPNAHLLSSMLYENPYGGQLWMLYDSNKQLLACGDAYARNYSVKLEKGDFVLRLQVRHHNKSQLDCLKDMCILIEFKLASCIALDAGSSRLDTLSAGCKFSPKGLSCGKTAPVYVSALSPDKLSKLSNCNCGDLLVGKFTLSKDESVKKKMGYQLQYVIGPKAAQKGKKNKATGENGAGKETPEAYAKAEKEFKLQWMKSGVLKPRDLEAEYEDDLDFLFAKLKLLQENKEYQLIPDLVSKVISKLDFSSILAHIGTKLNLSDTSTKTSELDKAKTILVETLLIEADAVLQLPSMSDSSPRVDDIYIQLCKFVDLKDSSLRGFLRQYAEARGHLATAVKHFMDELGDKAPSKDSYLKLTQYLEDLKWDHCARNRNAWMLRKYPASYQLF